MVGDSHQSNPKDTQHFILVPSAHLQIPDHWDWHCPHGDIGDDIECIESDHQLEPVDAVARLNRDIPILSDGPASKDECKRLGQMVCGDDKA